MYDMWGDFRMSKEIKVNLSEEDLQELMNGKEFHWCFDSVDIHLFKGEDE